MNKFFFYFLQEEYSTLFYRVLNFKNKSSYTNCYKDVNKI